MTQETVLANARVVTRTEDFVGAIQVRDGVIADISAGTSVPRGALDCEGDILCPGLVELHTDNLERHLTPRPHVRFPEDSAIIAHDAEMCGVGITTVFDALRVGSGQSNKSSDYQEYARALADRILDVRAQGALKVSHHIHLRAEVCSATLVEELDKFGEADRVRIVSLMDHTPGQRQFRDLDKLRAYNMGKYGLSEAEFQAHVEGRLALREQYGELHEAASVAAARRYGAVLASHDDTTEGQVAVSEGHGVKLAEFPTTREAAEACVKRGIKVIMGAPNLIRGGSHSGNVAARDLAEADLLDILSSDYVPVTLLSGAMMLADIWGDLPRAMATVTATPAEMTGLDDRGRIEVGLRADLLRVTRVGQGTAAVRGVWVAGERRG